MAQEERWLKSREARRVLRVSDCELAHLRQAGKLRFMKQGNAFLYATADCEELSQHRVKRAERKSSPSCGELFP